VFATTTRKNLETEAFIQVVEVFATTTRKNLEET